MLPSLDLVIALLGLAAGAVLTPRVFAWYRAAPRDPRAVLTLTLSIITVFLCGGLLRHALG